MIRLINWKNKNWFYFFGIIIRKGSFPISMDRQYPFTIYFKFYQYSEMSSAVYSVMGWYYYDKYQTKIPLVGLVTSLGMNLYVFDSNEKADTLLNFKNGLSDFWSEVEYYESMSGYIEKFICLQSDVSSEWTCIWQDKNRKLSLELNEMQFEIKRSIELLKFRDGSSFNLQNLGDWQWNFKLLASNSSKNTVLLSFDYPSRAYVGGMCGGGREKGFVGLQFSEKSDLVNYQIVKIWSCNDAIDLESKKEQNRDIEHFTTFSHDRQKYTSFFIDYKLATVNCL